MAPRSSASRSKRRQSVLPAAREALKRSQHRLMVLWSRLQDTDLIAASEAAELRALIKQGASNKVLSFARAESLRMASEAAADRLAKMLEALGIPVPTTPGADDAQPTAGPHTSELPIPEQSGADPGGLTRSTVASSGQRTDERSTVSRATSASPRRRKLAELSEAELNETALRQRLVSAMEGGLTARQALEHVGIKATGKSKRWAQRVRRAYDDHGRLTDARHAPAPRPKPVMTPAVQAFAEAQWLHHRAASAEGIRLTITRKLDALRASIAAGKDVSHDPLGLALLAGDVLVPSVQALYVFFDSLGEDKKKIRELGYEEWVRQHRPITKELPWATHANEEWQIDHTLADTWIRIQDDAALWKAVRPFVTAVIDVHSRAILAVVISVRQPDAFTTAITLRQAILPKSHPLWTPRGLPARLVLDNGKDFRAHSVAALLAALRIDAQFCNAYSPDEKPHIERWFLTMSTQLLPILPGYTHGNARGESWTPKRVDSLLTVEQFRLEVEKWTVEVYNQRAHGGTGRPPAALWEESVPGVEMPHVRDLDVLLLHTAERRVSRGLVRFSVRGHRAAYYAPGLTTRNGLRVLIRYNPDDLASILLYDAATREWLGEAWDIDNPRSHYSKSAIRAEARAARIEMAAYQQGLRERLPQYYEEVARTDRQRRERSGEAYREARSDAAAQLEIEHAKASEAASSLVSALQADQDAVRQMKANMRAAAHARSDGGSLAPDPTHRAPTGDSAKDRPTDRSDSPASRSA